MLRQSIGIIWSYFKIVSTVVGCYGAVRIGVMSIDAATVRACRRMVGENVLFVKCIQAMSSHPMIPTMLHPTLQAYTNCVPTDDADVDPTLLRYICDTYRVQLEHAHRHSGMVAVVWYGTIDQTPVVVKVVKSGIDARICDGCVHLRVLWHFLRVWSTWDARMASLCDVLDTVIESVQYLRRQCDLTHEQRAMRNVHDHWTKLQAQYVNTSSVCDRRNRIVVPRIWTEADERHASSFFIMQRVYGVPAFALRGQDVKRRGIALVQYFIISQMVLLDYYHTDMHSGNVLFDYNEHEDVLTVGIYDFGMHVSMDDRMREFTAGVIELLMSNETVHAATFDAVRFCRLFLDVPSDMNIDDTPQLRNILAQMGRASLTGALSAEIIQTYVQEIATLIGLKPRLNQVPLQVMLGTSMVNSLTFELSDNDMTLLARIGTMVYDDLMLS